jgi:hypothetical protein
VVPLTTTATVRSTTLPMTTLFLLVTFAQSVLILSTINHTRPHDWSLRFARVTEPEPNIENIT